MGWHPNVQATGNYNKINPIFTFRSKYNMIHKQVEDEFVHQRDLSRINCSCVEVIYLSTITNKMMFKNRPRPIQRNRLQMKVMAPWWCLIRVVLGF